MTAALDDTFGEESDPAAQPPLPARYRWGGRWFCPACGVRTDEDLECPRCGRHLRAFAFPLQELHPHGPTRSRPQIDPVDPDMQT